MAEKGKRRSTSPHDSGYKEKKRVKLSSSDIRDLSRDKLVSKWKEQEAYIDSLLQRLESSGASEVAKLKDSEAKLQLQVQESTRRENVLNMRLATKQQELQDMLSQVHDLKQAQNAENSQLHGMMVDPAINLVFQRMKAQLSDYKEKLEQAQSDLSAWKFTPDSVTGKKLMAKCRNLLQENQELGKQISQGRVAQLEAEVALQRRFNQEIKASQDELNEFVLQLDEEAEAMQSAIIQLQQKVKATEPVSTKSSSNPSPPTKERTKSNGPLETPRAVSGNHSNSASTSGSSSKLVSRSHDT